MENTTIYRDEKHGELHGLSRVRAISQDDSHAFVRPDQIKEELSSIMGMVRDMYATLGMEWFARLSLRDDSDKYLGDEKIWETAEKALREVVEETGIECVVGEGEAAFYGPKIDIMVRDALGREWQCATEQLDFVQPERFGLEYVDDQGQKQRPVMIHKALLGSVERFLSVYIEHTAGKFPIYRIYRFIIMSPKIKSSIHLRTSQNFLIKRNSRDFNFGIKTCRESSISLN
jgi:threonyl-tRNA synthetase